MKFIYFDETVTADNPDSESNSGTFAGLDSEQDYGQLIYEYLVSKEENFKTDLQEINNNLEWADALMALMVTLYLMNSCRRWINKITGGGLNDVS